MRLLVMSDLHIEFEQWSLPELDGYDVCVLAGDVSTKGRSTQWANDQSTRPTIVVAGNHEYYGSSWDKTLTRLRGAANPFIHFLEMDVAIVQGVRFVGCTGWSDFEGTGNPHLAMMDARAVMNDYKVIRMEPQYRRLIPQQTRDIARRSRTWLRTVLSQPFVGKTVVVTHFPPLMRFVPEVGTHTHLRAAYGNDWPELVDMDIDLWVFGHTHHPVDEVLAGTRFVSNPKGYPQEGVAFNPECIVTI